jgi:hypothetical protein
MGNPSSDKLKDAEGNGIHNVRASIMWFSLFILFVSGIVPFLVGATSGALFLESYMKACVLGPEDTDWRQVYIKLNEATIDLGIYEFYLRNWKCAAT